MGNRIATACGINGSGCAPSSVADTGAVVDSPRENEETNSKSTQKTAAKRRGFERSEVHEISEEDPDHIGTDTSNAKATSKGEGTSSVGKPKPTAWASVLDFFGIADDNGPTGAAAIVDQVRRGEEAEEAKLQLKRKNNLVAIDEGNEGNLDVSAVLQFDGDDPADASTSIVEARNAATRSIVNGSPSDGTKARGWARVRALLLNKKAVNQALETPKSPEVMAEIAKQKGQQSTDAVLSSGGSNAGTDSKGNTPVSADRSPAARSGWAKVRNVLFKSSSRNTSPIVPVAEGEGSMSATRAEFNISELNSSDTSALNLNSTGSFRSSPPLRSSPGFSIKGSPNISAMESPSPMTPLPPIPHMVMGAGGTGAGGKSAPKTPVTPGAAVATTPGVKTGKSLGHSAVIDFDEYYQCDYLALCEMIATDSINDSPKVDVLKKVAALLAKKLGMTKDVAKKAALKSHRDNWPKEYRFSDITKAVDTNLKQMKLFEQQDALVTSLYVAVRARVLGVIEVAAGLTKRANLHAVLVRNADIQDTDQPQANFLILLSEPGGTRAPYTEVSPAQPLPKGKKARATAQADHLSNVHAAKVASAGGAPVAWPDVDEIPAGSKMSKIGSFSSGKGSK